MRRKGKAISVLIIEGDARRLARDGIDAVGPLKAVLAFVNHPALAALGLAVHVEHVRGESAPQLARSLAPYFDGGHRPDVVVLIGHSNTTGFRLLDGPRGIRWGTVAEWLRPLDPKRLVLVGCEAGDWLPCGALFKGIASLEVIFGSPMKLTARQSVVELLVPALAFDLPKNLLVCIQALNFLQTNGVMLCRTRAEFEADPTERLASRAIDEFIKAVARDRATSGARRPAPHLTPRAGARAKAPRRASRTRPR